MGWYEATTVAHRLYSRVRKQKAPIDICGRRADVVVGAEASSFRCVPALPRPQLADLRRFVLRSFVAKQAITTIFLVEPTYEGWSVRIGDERLGSFSTHRQALNDVKNRRATLTAKGQRSTVVVTRHGSGPSKR